MNKITTFIAVFITMFSCTKPITLTSTPHSIFFENGGVTIVDTVKMDTLRVTHGKVKIPTARYFDRDEIDSVLYNDIKQYSLDSDTKYNIVVFTYDTYDVSKNGIKVLTTQIESEKPLKECKWSKVVGNLSGETFFAPTEIIEYLGNGEGWNYSKNFTASVVLKKDRDWWGHMGHQWTTEIRNISSKSWEKRFDIKLLFFNKDNKLEGEQHACVNDFVLCGESISKSIFYDSANMIDCFFAEYIRLYVNEIYCGEFVNSIKE